MNIWVDYNDMEYSPARKEYCITTTLRRFSSEPENLRIGDIVTAYDGESVDDPTSLVRSALVMDIDDRGLVLLEIDRGD